MINLCTFIQHWTKTMFIHANMKSTHFVLINSNQVLKDYISGLRGAVLTNCFSYIFDNGQFEILSSVEEKFQNSSVKLKSTSILINIFILIFFLLFFIWKVIWTSFFLSPKDALCQFKLLCNLQIDSVVLERKKNWWKVNKQQRQKWCQQKHHQQVSDKFRSEKLTWPSAHESLTRKYHAFILCFFQTWNILLYCL